MPRALTRSGRHPGPVVAREVARKAARSGALWGLIFAFLLIVQILAYTASYKTQAWPHATNWRPRAAPTSA